MCEECGCGEKGTQTVELTTKILDKNDKQARENRRHFSEHKIFAVNLMSSPGAGKTTLIEKIIDLAKDRLKIGVIEGDLETNRDAERIKAKGVPAHQISTGQACHLDAFMVHKGIHHLPLDELNLVFVENVGNLVCPAAYDIGAHLNVVLLSVPEGDDKPAKYPVMFRKVDMMIITKTDLIPYLDFNTEAAIKEARKLNPKIEIITVSAKTGEGLNDLTGQLFSKCLEV